MFIVEDGTGADPTANAYVSVAEFKAYWDDRGFDYSTFDDTDIEVAIVKATDYIELTNFGIFKGYILEEDQPLQWPRSGVYVNYQEADPLPKQLKYATFEYAKRALTSTDNDLQPDPVDRDETGQLVEKKFEKIGPIETDTTYIVGSGSSVRSYPAADRWLLPLLRWSGGGTVRN